MSDITKCKGTDCPFKKDCYRYTAPMGEWQSMLSTPPIKDNKCDMYWGKNPKKIWNEEEFQNVVERQFMNEMVTPKMRTMEADNNDYNNEIDKYIKTLESRMWKALGIVSIIMLTAILIALIVYK